MTPGVLSHHTSFCLLFIIHLFHYIIWNDLEERVSKASSSLIQYVLFSLKKIFLFTKQQASAQCQSWAGNRTVTSPAVL